MNFSAEQLDQFGWNSFFAESFQPWADHGLHAGRVILEHKGLWRVQTASGELTAGITGKLRHEAVNRADLPAVGDWVALRTRPAEGTGTIHAVLPRQSRFVRKTAGERTELQIVGANIDTIFLVTSLNQDFNPRRIERYLTSIWDGGASPVIILSKADLCDSEALLHLRLAEVTAIACGVPIHSVSVVGHQGLDELKQYCQAGKTIALIGSSGVGKSTLINYLAGSALQKVSEIRDHDGRGRHTTTRRELFLLPLGGLLLDTPGMRELQLWDGEAGAQVAFDDIAALIARCHFSDCQHRSEQRCAVRAALADGSLAAERLENYQKLQKEQRNIALKRDDVARRQELQRWKKLARLGKERAEMKRR